MAAHSNNAGSKLEIEGCQDQALQCYQGAVEDLSQLSSLIEGASRSPTQYRPFRSGRYYEASKVTNLYCPLGLDIEAIHTLHHLEAHSVMTLVVLYNLSVLNLTSMDATVAEELLWMVYSICQKKFGENALHPSFLAAIRLQQARVAIKLRREECALNFLWGALRYGSYLEEGSSTVLATIMTYAGISLFHLDLRDMGTSLLNDAYQVHRGICCKAAHSACNLEERFTAPAA
jgi:hypothetical protein